MATYFNNLVQYAHISPMWVTRKWTSWSQHASFFYPRWASVRLRRLIVQPKASRPNPPRGGVSIASVSSCRDRAQSRYSSAPCVSGVATPSDRSTRTAEPPVRASHKHRRRVAHTEEVLSARCYDSRVSAATWFITAASNEGYSRSRDNLAGHDPV